MKVAHILRKYIPSEWGGTETAVLRLMDGLAERGAESVVFAPAADGLPQSDPLREAGHQVKRYRAFIPVWGLDEEQRRQMLAVGGNLMSLELIRRLAMEPGMDVVHSHALNRIGGIGWRVAKWRKLPFVLTIHGGALDLPEAARQAMARPLEGGIEWGKIFGAVLGSRKLIEKADAVLTCNQKEAALLQERHPGQRVIVQPHAVPVVRYEREHWSEAKQAVPGIERGRYLLSVGRIDPVKNQLWLVEQFGAVARRHPGAVLVLAGSCTDEAYGKMLKKEIRNLGLDENVRVTGGFAPGDSALIGLFQGAGAVVLPSHSETFGLVLLEAWAAGTSVISTRTSGAMGLVQEGENGRLFDLDAPEEFHAAVDEVWLGQDRCRQMAENGRHLVRQQFDTAVLAGRVLALYQELSGRKT